MSFLNRCEPLRRARWSALVLLCAAPMIVGCVSRAAPFDELDDAQVTILRLQAQQQQPVQPPTGQPGTPLIPGLPTEWQQMGQQLLNQWQQYLPPGLLPGMGPGQPAAPQQPAQRLYKNQWVITAEQPLLDEKLKEELLDILGDDESFQMDRGNCFSPGMAAIFMAPTRTEPVEVLVSLSCNQAVGYGFPWPHPASGFTPETAQKMGTIYQRLFGPVPPGA